MTEIQEYFHSIFNYDHEKGVLYWKPRKGESKGDRIFNSTYALKEAGSVVSSKNSSTKYIQTKINGKTQKNHRIIFAMIHGYMPEQVDHIDHNGLNNRADNLRASNSKDNSKNLPMQKSNKSGHIGVNWHKSAKKWQARAVDLNGKRIDLGRFDSIDEAVAVRKKYEIEFKYYQHREDV